jgi:hypothetical protein
VTQHIGELEAFNLFCSTYDLYPEEARIFWRGDDMAAEWRARALLLQVQYEQADKFEREHHDRNEHNRASARGRRWRGSV